MLRAQARAIAPINTIATPANRIAGVSISKTSTNVRVAVTGAGANGVFRATDLEAALTKDFHAEALAGCGIDPGTMMRDQNGTPEYRANLVMVMARRAMENQGRISVFR